MCCLFSHRLQMGNLTDEIPAMCLGETGALSLKKPTEQDIKDTEDMEACLSEMDIFEPPSGMALRREALVRLQEISNTWIREKAREQNLPPHIVSNTSGKIFTFGSYRMGLNFKGADVDSLLVVPRFITREEFFTEFLEILTNDANVEDIHAVVDAYVPVLKMKFMDVEVCSLLGVLITCLQIDLLFAQLDQMTIADNFNLCENTESLLRNMDERDVRSVNGVRVAGDILNLVYNKTTFKTALKVGYTLLCFDKPLHFCRSSECGQSAATFTPTRWGSSAECHGRFWSPAFANYIHMRHHL